jgi:transmembrane sensor
MNTLRDNDDETGSGDDALLNEATDWLICLNETDPDPNDPYADPEKRKKAFFAWVKQSEQHLRVFMEVSDVECRLRDLSQHPVMELGDLVDLPVPSRTADPVNNVSAGAVAPIGTEQPKSRQHLQWAAGAAGVVAVVAIGAKLIVARDIPVIPTTYITNVGQQQSFTLNDGTVMSLNTDTEVVVSISKRERNIHLIRGETYLKIAHDPRRMLTVSTDYGYVRDVGTEIDAQKLPDGMKIVVASGNVEAGINEGKNADGRQIVSAGHEATISSGQVQISEVNIENALAWREHRLVFHEDRLAFVAEQFNRYNMTQMRVEGTAAEGTLVTGSYDINSYEEILKFARSKHLAVVQDGNDWVIRSKH